MAVVLIKMVMVVFLCVIGEMVMVMVIDVLLVMVVVG